jgi:hypothetical protein
VRPHLGYPANRLISTLRLGERRPAPLRTRQNTPPADRGAAARHTKTNPGSFARYPPARGGRGKLTSDGTDGSNPCSSSGESTNHRVLGGGAASAVCAVAAPAAWGLRTGDPHLSHPRSPATEPWHLPLAGVPWGVRHGMSCHHRPPPAYSPTKTRAVPAVKSAKAPHFTETTTVP